MIAVLADQEVRHKRSLTQVMVEPRGAVKFGLTMEANMVNADKVGGVAALYMALAHLCGIAIFLVVLDYPNITSPVQKVELLAGHETLIRVSNLGLYVVFGLSLVVLMVPLHSRLKADNAMLAPVGAAIGLIWAGSLIASGMVANAGITPALALWPADPELAAQTWAATETVADGLGNANGEILGGAMTLVLSLAGLKSGFPRLLVWLGIAVGLVGLMSVVPGLTDLVGVFGLSQILWFAGLAFVLLRKRDV
jgi:hypothetical protein